MVLRKLIILALALVVYQMAQGQCSKYKLFANDSVGCLNDIISFKTIPSPPSGSVLNWDFEIKSVTNEATPTVAFTKDDTFTCKVEIKLPTNETCNLERKDYVIIAADPPLAEISSTKSEICELGKNATLSVKSSANSFTWSVDGTVYNNRGNSVQHNFTSAGYKQVQIVATGRFGCTSTRIYDSVLLVVSKPTVSFPSSQLVLCGKSDVTLDPAFTFFGTNDFTYDWELDGASIKSHTTQFPSEVTYSTPGTYDVGLTMNSNVTSCSYDYDFADYVLVENAPDIEIRATPLNGTGCKSKIYSLKLLGTGLDTNRISWFHNHGDTIEIKKVTADSVVISSEVTGKYQIFGKYSLAKCDKLVSAQVTLESNDLLADFEDDIPCICNIPSQLTIVNNSVSFTAKTLSYDWEVRNVKKEKLLASSTQKDLTWTVDRFGNFIVTLRATDSDGCYEEKKHLVEARPFDAELRIAPRKVCPGSTVRFEPRDTMCYEAFDSVFWTIYDLDGVKIKSQKNDVSHTLEFTDTGYYNAEVIITTSGGCRDVVIRDSAVHVTALQGIKLDYDASKSYCLGETISVSAQTKTPGIDGEWFGFLISDTDSDTAIYSNELKFNPTSPGTYDLKVVFISEHCKDSVYFDDVFDVGGVLFDFDPDDSTGCLPFTTTLRSTVISNTLVSSTDQSLDYEWFISPNNIGTILPVDSPNAVLSITNRGTASVGLRVTNSENCISELVKANLFNFDLLARFDLPQESCTGLKLTPNNSSKGTFSKIEWSVDDPTATFEPSSTTLEPQITFNKPGDYTVKLLLEDDNGCQETRERDISIIKFKFDFVVDDSIPKCSPASFTFTSTGINIDSFYWDFGDGEDLVSTSDSVYLKVYDLTRVNPYKNIFDVMLYAENSIGCHDSVTADNLITVRGPVPNFEIVNSVGCEPHEVEFINNSISTKKVFFDFGDNSSVDSVNYSKHTYSVQDPDNEFEVFKPFIVVHDEYNCKLSYSPEDSIVVYALPRAKFGHTIEKGCSPHTVEFSDSSVFAYNWIWHFGDGDSLADSSKNASRTYEVGTYRPYLVVSNSLGCTDTLKIGNRVESLKPPRALFNISDTITCIGVPIDFIDSTRAKYPVYEWKWDFGDPNQNGDTAITKNSSYSYDADGEYDVTLIVVDSNGCTDTLIRENGVRIYQELPIELPKIDLVDVVNDLDVELKFDATPAFAFGRYILHETNALRSDETIFKRSDTALTIRGLVVDTNQYCFNIEMIDKCGFSHPGDTHCTVLLTVDRTKTEVTNLSWTHYVGWDSLINYTLYRGRPGQVLNPFAVLSPNATAYIDSSVCSEEYEYAVKAMRDDDSLLSSSNHVDFEPQYVFQLNPLDARLATVRNATVRVSWEKSIQRNVKTYVIDRKASDNLWINGWKRTTDTLFIDSSARTQEKSYLYRVKVVDQCEYKSEKSNLASSILLNARPTERDYNVFWTQYRKWPSGVKEYIVQRRGTADAPFRTMDVVAGTDTNYLDTSAFLLFEKSFSYRVLAVESANEPDTSYSNIRAVEPIPTLYVPNAFSPNQNGVNDVFNFKSVALLPDSIGSNFEMQIFNRWGERVFYSQDQNEGWDGQFNGVVCQGGVYVYVINAEGLDGSKLYRKGSITLLR